MARLKLLVALIFLLVIWIESNAQTTDEKELKLSGQLFTDQRFLLESPNDWAWNETRITLKLNKKIKGNASFYSEVWLRNIGLPDIATSADLYNKGIVDPYNLEIRQAYVQLPGFIAKNLDLTIGRQIISWGTADKLNPTDNLNPYDMEDILDFGRHRGADAINLNYYFINDFSIQAVFIPFFQPANLPVGIFSNALNSDMEIPQGVQLESYTDSVAMPRYDIGESSSVGLRFKGYAKGVDFSLSYVYGLDGIPMNTQNTIIPGTSLTSINVSAEISYVRNHIFGADLATSIGGIGLWAEGALFDPQNDVYLTTDYSAYYPSSPVPVTTDSLLLDKTKPYLKFIVGGDYFFGNGSYLNVQYMHGFIHERGDENLNDYFFMQYEMKFLREKLKFSPIGGGYIVSDWSDVKNNYAIVYMPQLSYQASENTEIILSTAIFDGKGSSLFSQLNDYDMFMLKVKYSF